MLERARFPVGRRERGEQIKEIFGTTLLDPDEQAGERPNLLDLLPLGLKAAAAREQRVTSAWQGRHPALVDCAP